MAYIGNTATTQGFVPAVDYFNGNASTTAFTLSRPVASVVQVQAVIENVPQNPGSAFTVSGNTITFTSAPPSGTSNIYVYYTSPITQDNPLTQSPSLIGSVQTTKGFYSTGSYTAGYSDGVVLDYTTGLGRVSVGGSDGVAFYNGGVATTELMRLDSSGNLGIGTNSPAAKLNVTGSSSNAVAIFDKGASGQAYTQLKNSAQSFSTYVDINNNSTNWLATYDTTNSALVDVYVPGASAYRAFYTVGTERARIDSSGNLLVGTTTLIAQERLNVTRGGSNLRVVHFENTRNTSGDENLRVVLGSNCSNTSSYSIICSTGGTDKLYVYGNGNVVNSNNSYGALSDAAIKENIVDTSPKLEKLMQVKVRNYNLIEDESKAKQIGVVAQELEEVFPSMVEVDGLSGHKQVKYSVFVPMLIKAIQEQQAIITSLTERITALENK